MRNKDIQDNLLELASYFETNNLKKESKILNRLIVKTAGTGWMGLAQGVEPGYSIENGKIFYRSKLGGPKRLIWEPGDVVPELLQRMPMFQSVLPQSTRPKAK